MKKFFIASLILVGIVIINVQFEILQVNTNFSSPDTTKSNLQAPRYTHFPLPWTTSAESTSTTITSAESNSTMPNLIKMKVTSAESTATLPNRMKTEITSAESSTTVRLEQLHSKEESRTSQDVTHVTTQIEDPPLFMDRLEQLLPKKEFLTWQDVAQVEDRILRFNVSRLTIVELDAEYIPIHWRSQEQGVAKVLDRCPKCVVRLKNNAQKMAVSSSLPESSKTLRSKVADVYMNAGCPGRKSRTDKTSVCDCGESQKGTGQKYYSKYKTLCDLNAGFFPSEDPLSMTFGSRELTLPQWQLGTVSKLVRLLQTMPDLERKPLLRGIPFIHSNCGGVSGRGTLFKQMINDGIFPVARYGGCWNNANAKNFEPPNRESWYWHDSQGNRDATKTNIVSHYKFSEALENTKSHDYFTEKRYQAFFANSLPIMFRNHNSVSFTPHPSSAIFVEDHGNTVKKQARNLARLLEHLDSNNTAYLEYFQWKQAGPTREFVKHLFRSSNYQLCRICELVS